MYFVEKTKDINFLKKFDYILFALVAVLSIIGLLSLSSVSQGRDNGTRMMIVQIGCMAVGVICAIVISMIDYKDFKALGIIFYIVTVVLLILVLLIGSGDTIGSRSWVKIAGVKFQPSEFAKVSFIMVASVFLERIRDDQKNRNLNIAKFLFYSAFITALVVAQKDFGTSMVFAFIFFVFIFICGISYKYIFACIGMFLAIAPIVWFKVLNTARRERILVFFDPDRDRYGSGYNVIRSKVSIGSGQIFGKGLFKGMKQVPVNESDFIFSVIGEELGFIGAVVVILTVCIFLMRCIHIAKNARDSYGTFLVMGVTSYLGIHFVENIGMSVGVLPVTGIPQPFISQGGTSIIANFIAVGIVLSVSMRRQKVIFNSSS